MTATKKKLKVSGENGVVPPVQHATMQEYNPARVFGVANITKWLPSHDEYRCWTYHIGPTGVKLNLRESQTDTIRSFGSEWSTFHHVA